MREGLKAAARAFALIAVLPSLASYYIRSAVMGPDRALEGSAQALSVVPGILGQYLRRAFLSRTLAACSPTATICFGTLFSQTGTRIDDQVYIGPGCSIGLAHVERDVLIGSGVHITSGRHTHGNEDASRPMREQEGRRQLVRIGAGAWIGSGAIVMADVGAGTIIGAGAVVTGAIPDAVVAAGVPARTIRNRS